MFKKQNVANLLSVDEIEKNINNFVPAGASTVEKGIQFSRWTLMYLFELDDNTIEDSILIGGPGDNGVDAFFEYNNSLIVVQCKYDTAHTTDAMISTLHQFKCHLNRSLDYSNANPQFMEFIDRLQEYITAPEQVKDEFEKEYGGKQIEFYYITSAYFKPNDIKQHEILRDEITSQYGNVSIEFVDIHGIHNMILKSLHELPEFYRHKKQRLSFRKQFVTGYTCVAEVGIKDFYLFLRKVKDYVFFFNVRNYLPNSIINKEIAKTFRDNDKDFWFYNNGITILCDDFDNPNEDYLYIDLYAPQIVNGCQTSSVILREFQVLEKKPNRKELIDKKEGSILVKIIKDKSHLRRDGIIQCTNRQNVVSAMDFYALDSFHKELKEKFAELGYFYEIQRKESQLLKGSKGTFKPGKNQKNKDYSYLTGDKFNYIITVKDVVQSHAAGMYGKVIKAGHNLGELAPNTPDSKEMFNSSTNCDIRYFLYPVLVSKYANMFLGYGSKKSGAVNVEDDLGYRRTTLSLFTYTYFKLICRFLKLPQILVMNAIENDDPFKIPLDTIEKIFRNEETNTYLLELVDQCLFNFFDDTSIKKRTDNNISKFMKSDVEKQEVLATLTGKMDSLLRSKLNPMRIAKIKELIG